MVKISLENPNHRYILQCILRTITNKTKSRRKELAKKYDGLKSAEITINRKDFKGKFNVKFLGGMKEVENYLNFLHNLEIIWPADFSPRGEPILFDNFYRGNKRNSLFIEQISFDVFFNPIAVANFLKKLSKAEKDYIIRTKFVVLNTQNGLLNIKDIDGTIIKDRTKKLKTTSANFFLLKMLLKNKKLTLKELDKINPRTDREQKISALRKLLGINLQEDLADAVDNYPQRNNFPFQIKRLKDKYALSNSR
ncbi:MAG: hypothetical protein WC582_00895 [Patescibacteria group bacterium]